MGLVALIAVGATFAVAAIVLAVLSLLAGDRAKVRDAWTVYALQFLTMGVILVPAYVGGILFTVVVALLAGLCLLEFLGAQKDAVPIAMKVTAVAFGAGPACWPTSALSRNCTWPSPWRPRRCSR